MTIRQLHEAKLREARAAYHHHHIRCDMPECDRCEVLAEEIERHMEAIAAIDKGSRQMRITNQ